MDATLGGEGSKGRRAHPPSKDRSGHPRPGSRFGSKSSRSRVRRRRSEFPASREFSCDPVGLPFQKALQCHGVVGFATRRLQARSGAEQGISGDRNRSLSGAFGTEQGKNRRAKTGCGAGRGQVVRRGQDSLSQPARVALVRSPTRARRAARAKAILLSSIDSLKLHAGGPDPSRPKRSNAIGRI
jgi:hypothetical protein